MSYVLFVISILIVTLFTLNSAFIIDNEDFQYEVLRKTRSLDSNSTEVATQDEDISVSETETTAKKHGRAVDVDKTPLITSRECILDHITWGDTKDLKCRDESASKFREFVAYGPCRQRRVVHYDFISKSRALRDILSAYSDLFRTYCKKDTTSLISTIFAKGYAQIEADSSAKFSRDAAIFIKSKLTYAQMDELEILLEFVAFTQVYVSWHWFPVRPINPKGDPISEKCFFEAMARLHALDLLATVARRHLARVSFDMGIRMKAIVKEMKDEYVKINTQHSPELKGPKDENKKCLVLGMALLEFFTKQGITDTSKECAHEAFRRFFIAKEAAYIKLAEKFDKKT